MADPSKFHKPTRVLVEEEEEEAAAMEIEEVEEVVVDIGGVGAVVVEDLEVSSLQ